MRRCPPRLIVFSLAFGGVCSGAAATIVEGRAVAQTISMTAAPATPELHGPFLWAARPGTPLLFTVPATGQAPLTFSATGLPDGLMIAADTGTITGTTPAAGMYPVEVTATNASGTAKATYTIAASTTYALTPPMGWNSYDSFGASVNESEFLAAAQAQKTLLAPYGWNTAVIDYLWYDNEQTIDANGRWMPSATKWPSSAGGKGLKPIADKIHAMGLSFGIHIMRGIPRKAFTANSPIANSTSKAQDAGNNSDTCPWDSHNYGVRGDTAAGQAWYDSIFAQYATWDLDFVKVDDMVSGTNYHQSEVNAIRAAIDKTGRSIVLSLSPGPMQTRDTANLNMNANMWRTVNDFWDTSGLSNLNDVFTAARNWQMQTLVPGHWPDCDMLPLGYIGPRPPVGGGARMSALSHAEQVQVMTLWGIMPSPLMLGGNPSKLSGDTWTIALLTNPEVLAINQDVSGSHAKQISMTNSAQVWSRALSGGRVAVALINRSATDATLSATFAQLGVTGTPAVRDVWQRKDVTGMTTGVSASVTGNSGALFLLTPPGSGTGGSGGGGSSGTGGRGPDGGAPDGAASGGSSAGGSGGVPATGGSAATGGRASGGTTATGGGNPAGGNATGGSASGGASNGAGGTGGGGPASGGQGAKPPTSGDSGCSLEGGAEPLGLTAAAVSLLLAGLRRRRRIERP